MKCMMNGVNEKLHHQIEAINTKEFILKKKGRA